MTLCLHQEPALICLFALIIDKLIGHIQKEVPWCMSFENDIMVVDESRDGVNAELERQ